MDQVSGMQFPISTSYPAAEGVQLLGMTSFYQNECVKSRDGCSKHSDKALALSSTGEIMVQQTGNLLGVHSFRLVCLDLPKYTNSAINLKFPSSALGPKVKDITQSQKLTILFCL